MAVTGLGLIALVSCNPDGGNPSAPAAPADTTFRLLIEWPTVSTATNYVLYRDFQCGATPLTGVLATVPQEPTPMMHFEDTTVGLNTAQVCYEVSAITNGSAESAHSARVTAPLR